MRRRGASHRESAGESASDDQPGVPLRRPISGLLVGSGEPAPVVDDLVPEFDLP
jgi:hypothetical protein